MVFSIPKSQAPEANFNPSSQATAATAAAPDTGKPDILFVIFIYLMMVVNNDQKSAQLQAKQLQLNGLEQMSYNKEDQKINLVSVPNYHKKVSSNVHSHWHFGLGRHKGDFHVPGIPLMYFTLSVTKKIVSSNGVQIAMAQSQNEKNDNTRQGIASKLAVLNQIAQGEQVNLNSSANLASQAINEGSGFLSMIKSLTNKIMVNH